ncbi:hypothetical protein AYI68_g5610 [Smittium mucronatum]|uniref:Uncharacterized protein n=1 Tax=Smittium mucronatum TaxID=133383 RepID=A0A1R0GTS7_9FUNG|nr:hypothetical protein AYI68_g5610 [Smittium mucronatum]
MQYSQYMGYGPPGHQANDYNKFSAYPQRQMYGPDHPSQGPVPMIPLTNRDGPSCKSFNTGYSASGDSKNYDSVKQPPYNQDREDKPRSQKQVNENSGNPEESNRVYSGYKEESYGDRNHYEKPSFNRENFDAPYGAKQQNQGYYPEGSKEYLNYLRENYESIRSGSKAVNRPSNNEERFENRSSDKQNEGNFNIESHQNDGSFNIASQQNWENVNTGSQQIGGNVNIESQKNEGNVNIDSQQNDINRLNPPNMGINDLNPQDNKKDDIKLEQSNSDRLDEFNRAPNESSTKMQPSEAISAQLQATETPRNPEWGGNTISGEIRDDNIILDESNKVENNVGNQNFGMNPNWNQNNSPFESNNQGGINENFISHEQENNPSQQNQPLNQEQNRDSFEANSNNPSQGINQNQLNNEPSLQNIN